MATPIPGFASQVESSGETVQVTTGTQQTLSNARYYYFLSNKAAAEDGQCLLRALKDLLEASLAGVTWNLFVFKYSGVYKVSISHNSGTSKTVTFSSSLATALGFASASFAIATSTTVVADYPSIYWWTPDMPVSLTGPIQFDPSISYGVPESAGASQRAPDMTTAYVQNGEQWSAEYTFNGVQYLYTIRAQSGYTNRDLETWWRNGPAKGRRFLMWRDRDNATIYTTPTAGSSSPYYYIEYAPQETLRKSLPAAATSPPNMAYWDVKLDLWVTENGETPLAD